MRGEAPSRVAVDGASIARSTKVPRNHEFSVLEGAMNGTRRYVAAVAAALAAIAVVVGANADNGTGNGTNPPKLQFLGQAIVPTGTTFAGTTIGGLSSITLRRVARRRTTRSPTTRASSIPRASTRCTSTSRDGHLDNGDVTFTGVTTLQAPGGGPYAPFSLDPEGLTLTKDGELIVTSEGITNERHPAVRPPLLARRRRSSATCRCRTRSSRRTRRTVCGRTSRSRPPPSRRPAVTSTSAWRTR